MDVILDSDWLKYVILDCDWLLQYMLSRIMILNLLSLYSLMLSLIGKTDTMATELHNFKMMNDSSLISGQVMMLCSNWLMDY